MAARPARATRRRRERRAPSPRSIAGLPLLDLPPPIVLSAPASPPRPSAFTRGAPPGVLTAFPHTVTLALPFGPFSREVALADGEVAARAWSELPHTAVRLRVVGVDGATVSSTDGVSTVRFHTGEWPAELVPRALAQTVLVVDGAGHITDADIHVNGFDHVYRVDGLEAPGAVDLRSVLVHELGHLLGLGHSADPLATMAPSVSGTRARTPARDDELGVATLYPGPSGAARCPDIPCPPGFSCLAGACERRGTPKVTCAPCERVPGACDGAGAEGRCVDVDQGAARVCAPRCDADHPCGPGFACQKTTSAGDEQCVATDGCRALGVPCAADAECGAFTCREGRCVGPGEAPAGGLDAGLDGSPAPPGPAPAGPPGGCASGGATPRTVPHAATFVLALALLLGALRARRG